MENDLLEIVETLSLKGEKINKDLYYPKGIEYGACDCGCEQDGEGFCMNW